MSGLVRADWLRLRKRRSVQAIVLVVPLLAAFFFLTSYASLATEPPPFDEAAFRAQVLADGGFDGLPPEQVEEILSEMVAAERQFVELLREQARQARGLFAFPQSMFTILGSAGLVFFALILVTALTIGDEFAWGTIRTTLIASSDRSAVLRVRLLALIAVAALLLLAILALGALLPIVLIALGADLPAGRGVDAPAVAVLLAVHVVASLAVVGFAALGTLIVRSGGMTLVIALVYLLVEAAILGMLLRFPPFQQDGNAGWTLDLLPIRGINTAIDAATQAAGAQAPLMGQLATRDLGDVWVPLAAVATWAGLLVALAFRRFARMDIVE